MALISLARLIVAAMPFRIWRGWLGGCGSDRPDCAAARRLAAQIERATWRLPIEVKCLPQAMALSWLLRRHAIGHELVLAIRPQDARGGRDDLHAWVECAGIVILGDLPGPWTTIHTLGDR